MKPILDIIFYLREGDGTEPSSEPDQRPLLQRSRHSDTGQDPPVAPAIRARGRRIDLAVSPITRRAAPLPSGAPPRSAAAISHSADRFQRVQQEIQKLEENIRNATSNPTIATSGKVTEPSQPLPSTAPGQVQQEIILIEARLRPPRTELHRMQGKILANRQGLTADPGSPETTPLPDPLPLTNAWSHPKPIRSNLRHRQCPHQSVPKRNRRLTKRARKVQSIPTSDGPITVAAAESIPDPAPLLLEDAPPVSYTHLTLPTIYSV